MTNDWLSTPISYPAEGQQAVFSTQPRVGGNVGATLLEDIHITLQPDVVIERLRLQRTRGHEVLARDFIQTVMDLAQPRAMYVALPIQDRSRDWVEIGGIRFTSAILARHTRTAQRVFPYLVTLGSRLEEAAKNATDILEQYCLHEVANLALDQARELVRERVEETQGLQKLYSLAPGSLADWPITEQRGLFALLGDTGKHLGVRLTESFLMIPQKSLSGILFPSAHPFVSCRFCNIGDCPGRQVAFDPDAAGAVEGETPCRP